MKKKLLHLLILLFLASTGHAYYQTEQGRWLNRDPIGEEGGENLYAACLNQCVNHVDFLGLDDECPCTDEQTAAASNAENGCRKEAADALRDCLEGCDTRGSIANGVGLVAGIITGAVFTPGAGAAVGGIMWAAGEIAVQKCQNQCYANFGEPDCDKDCNDY